MVVPYLIKITGAKFEHYLSNIFGDNLNFVIYYSHAFSLWRQQFLNKHLNISETGEAIPKYKKTFFFIFKGLQNIIFKGQRHK